MKSLLRRLHLAGSPGDHPDGAHTNPKAAKNRFSISDPPSVLGAAAAESDTKPFPALSSLLTAAKHTITQAGNLKYKKEGSGGASGHEFEDFASDSGGAHGIHDDLSNSVEEDKEHFMASHAALSSVAVPIKSLDCRSSDSTCLVLTADSVTNDTAAIVGLERAQTAETAALRRASDQAVFLQDEEFQVRVAMALSVRDDPEAAAIETAKDLSLGSDPSLSNSTAHLLAYRYWKYNRLGYEDKVADGFYDVYGVVSDLSSEVMPSLIRLQETAVSEPPIWEAVLVNRATDNELVNLERKAIALALCCELVTDGWKKSGVLNGIAEMVAERMGGPVNDADFLLESWRSNCATLRLSLQNFVLPLGGLSFGLGRHRALLFKILADAVGIPCQLVKGRQYTGGDEAAVNIIKVDTGREFIIDLMAAPGTLIPYDASVIIGSEFSVQNIWKDLVSLSQTTGKVGQDMAAGRKVSRIVESGKEGIAFGNIAEVKGHRNEYAELKEVHAIPVGPHASRSVVHQRSPSWTEGVGSPAVRDTKVKDVSQYMMDAAKDNPTLAQKLHDVLLESGVQAPPDLFNEISPRQLHAQISEDWKILDENQRVKAARGDEVRRKQKNSVGPGRPLCAVPSHSSSSEEGGKERLRRLSSVKGLGERRPLDLSFLSASPSSSPNSSASSGAAVQSVSPVLPAAAALTIVQDNLPAKRIKHVPVAAAAAATAAVVASSMVVAATKTDLVSDPTLDVPVAAAATATATAAVVVATSAVAGRCLELLSEPLKELVSDKGGRDAIDRRQEEANARTRSMGDGVPQGQCEDDYMVSDKSSGFISTKSDHVLEDVAEWEIPWEELVIGERIGLGSYGEVYRADWHGTEIAVKKFLDQDISGDALLEFGSEVRLMKRMRHPNVVLFMGAVMRAPNLSIVTEFLPRGSLYRLIHRSNSQLDERRRMRMALDVARGMNYLHNSSPVIVHRDLKSPNLLVDRNWVVKVCDFGLSRMKHNTFLSSKSTAGTPEWMAPEVLRNEPSNEKSDVYSFGVILWELATLQQPWAGMNPMQVVGAIGFQHRTLDIPDKLDPVLVRIIRQCWQSDPALRPSFADLMDALKPLQKPITQSQSSEG